MSLPIRSINSMLNFITSSFMSIKPLKTIATVGAKLLLCLGFIYVNFYINPGFAMAASQTLNISTLDTINIPMIIAQTSSKPLNVDRAAEKADQASENIYEGLDTTKRIIGKTDKRNQIIEEARDHASQKWQSLADKAKAAQNSDTELTPTEEQVLKQVEN